MYGLLLTFHLLAATIWTGGHIILSLVILPRVLKERAPHRLLEFESVYEKIGMPALAIQIITGLILAYQLLPHIPSWFDMSIPLAHGILTKLILLCLTIAFAVDARLRVVPKLSASNLNDMAFHIIAVTILSILFVLTGVSFRAGWLI